MDSSGSKRVQCVTGNFMLGAARAIRFCLEPRTGFFSDLQALQIEEISAHAATFCWSEPANAEASWAQWGMRWYGAALNSKAPEVRQ
jgi:hypothetical protein